MYLLQVEVIWFNKPHGSPSGVCTGQRKPQDLYFKKKTNKYLYIFNMIEPNFNNEVNMSDPE